MKKSFLYIFLALSLILSGCSSPPPENASSVNSDASIQSPFAAKDKSYDFLENKTIAWGLKKNKNQAPDVPEEYKTVLKNYGAVYMSEKPKTLYLTFDEGYENGHTAQILDTLKKTNTPAAFFITGDYIKKEPDLVSRMVSEGHIVGNHTQNHPSMPSVTNNDMLADELLMLDESFFNLCGMHMRYIRPPKGEFSQRTLAISRDMGYTTVLWSFAYADWERAVVRGPEYAYKCVMDYLHDGAIILLHAVSADNADALEQIITDARAKGFVFESLDNL